MRCLTCLWRALARWVYPDDVDWSGDPIDEHHDASRPVFLPDWHRARLDRGRVDGPTVVIVAVILLVLFVPIVVSLTASH